MFVFGQDLGDGSKNSHLRLGFTSMKLIKLINKFGNKGVWHIDATYKIIKYCYPLIAVLGFTDIAHHFHPVTFMFTSNETGADYDHFFESFIETCTQNDVVFDLQFMVSDAARVII